LIIDTPLLRLRQDATQIAMPPLMRCIARRHYAYMLMLCRHAYAAFSLRRHAMSTMLMSRHCHYCRCFAMMLMPPRQILARLPLPMLILLAMLLRRHHALMSRQMPPLILRRMML